MLFIVMWNVSVCVVMVEASILSCFSNIIYIFIYSIF